MTSPFASYRSETEQRNPLVAGPRQTYTEKFILPSGLTLAAGAIVGRVLGAVTPAAAAGNTAGSGTIASATLGAGAKAGVYQIICVEPASNAGAFLVEDPDGNIVGRATVAVEFVGPITFTITDANDFVVGDRFTVTVANGDEVKLVTAAATDGSQRAFGVAVMAADATDGEVEVLIYTEGDFDITQVSVGAGLTVDDVKEDLRKRNIKLIAVANA
jgi:hypothetical protein